MTDLGLFPPFSNKASLHCKDNIKLDVYGMKTDWYVVDEQTKDLKMLRNYMEHKSIIIKDEPMSHTEYQLTISKQELELNTIRLAQLVRCAIIYLCNFVMHAEYDKHGS